MVTATVKVDGQGQSQRDRIRLAAIRLFTHQGYAGTSMKQLANELGMVPANLYNYYPKKEAILFEVLSYQLTSLLARDTAIVEAHPEPVDQVYGLAYDLVFEDLRDPQAAFVGQHGINGLTKDGREKISSLMGEVRAMWRQAVEDGVASGDFETPDPKLSTLTIITLCSSTSTWYNAAGEFTPESVAEHTAAAALRSLGHPTELPQALRGSGGSRSAPKAVPSV
ncbi:MAG: TetR family transcriptional regulator [Propionibacteriales bacterium]|nr:TetR family transcriptional regulator [Propionibacteriales bacterium]